jgi:hypothetical protein
MNWGFIYKISFCGLQLKGNLKMRSPYREGPLDVLLTLLETSFEKCKGQGMRIGKGKLQICVAATGDTGRVMGE